MSRVVVPRQFLLFASTLDDTARLATKTAGDINTSEKLGMNGDVPVALRWTTDPALGFSRKPFLVFRRPSGDPRDMHALAEGEQRVDGSRDLRWSGAPMYIIEIFAKPDAGRVLTVEALDENLIRIPGQLIQFFSTGSGRFQVPGMVALRVTGSGSVTSVSGVEADVYANLPDWELIQIVGFPLKDHETTLPVYNAQPQGWLPSLRSGVDAARLRLLMSSLFDLPLPPTSSPTFPLPAWSLPDPLTFIDALRGGAVPRILDCLANSDDADASRLQASYAPAFTTDGVRHADPSMPPAGAGGTAQVVVPIVATTLIATSIDSYSALALGYGTIDLYPLDVAPRGTPGPLPSPPITTLVQAPAGTPPLGFDYMVTRFTTLRFGLPGFPPMDIELAALSQGRLPPQPPARVDAARARLNRPPSRDTAATEAVRLTWPRSMESNGYIVLENDGSASRVLNTRRIGFPSPAPVYEPYAAIHPHAAMEDIGVALPTIFVVPTSPVPIDAPETQQYLVATRDVFGRTSAWSRSVYTSQPVEPSLVGIHKAELVYGDPPAITGTVVEARLEIEFSWDWSDRSPQRIRFTNSFGSSLPVPSGFALGSSGPAGGAIDVLFDAAGTPSIPPPPPSPPSPHTIEQLTLPPTSPPPDSDKRMYRLTVNGMRLDFGTGTKLSCSVRARGLERLRTSEGPPSEPRRAHASDPRKPAEPLLPPDLRWTALPDATGVARGLLQWAAVAGADHYDVWEASETALRLAIDNAAAEPPNGASFMARAVALRDLAATTPHAASRSHAAFTRITTERVIAPRFEVELPARIEELRAYRVTAVSAENQPSERGAGFVLFGVPKLVVPTQPAVTLRTIRGESGGTLLFGFADPAAPLPGSRGILVIVVLPGPGETPAGYRLFRTRSLALTDDVGAMGPPVADVSDPRWLPLSLIGTTARWRKLESFAASLTAFEIANGRMLLDAAPALAERWRPYVYRAVAVGDDSPPDGRIGGVSQASAVRTASFPPGAAPTIDSPAVAVNATNFVLTFSTTLPVLATPLGAATIEAYELATAGTRLERRPLFTPAAIPADGISEGSTPTLFGAPGPAELALLPRLVRNAPSGSVTQIALQGLAIARGVVILRDPLGRTVSFEFLGAP